jgi:hypothetical protein
MQLATTSGTLLVALKPACAGSFKAAPPLLL